MNDGRTVTTTVTRTKDIPNSMATFVPIETVAKQYNVSLSTFRKWVREGVIPQKCYVKVGKTFRFSPDAVAAALLNHRDLNSKDDDDPFEGLEKRTSKLLFDEP